MRPPLTIFLTLCLCSGAWAQGWTVFGNQNSLTDGAVLCADGVMYSDGSPAGYTNCLYMPTPEEYLNGYAISWPSVTNHPDLAPYGRTMLYDLYIATNDSPFVQVQEVAIGPPDLMNTVWVPKDYWFGTGPTPQRVYFTSKASLLDPTNVPTPAWAYWQYSTNCIGCSVTQSNLSDGSENPVPTFRLFTNSGAFPLIYLGLAGAQDQVSNAIFTNSYGKTWCACSVDPNDPVANTNGCNWWLNGSIYFIARVILGCGGSRGASYDLHEIGHTFELGHADTVNRSGNGFSLILDGGDTLDLMYEFVGPMQFNSFYLEKLGWAGAYGNRPIIYAKQPGIYTITRTASQSPGPKALKILREKMFVYTLSGDLGYQTNTFYYLDAMDFYPAVNGPAVVARVGTPLPYHIPSIGWTLPYEPHSKRVMNYGHSGGLISGDSFSDVYTETVIRQLGNPGPWSTNSTGSPFTVTVLSVNATNATIAVSF